MLYFATVQLCMSAEDFWLMPVGLFLDLLECHKQFMGLVKPLRFLTIDDVIPWDM